MGVTIGVLIGLALGGSWTLAERKSVAGKAIGRLVDRGGLPVDAGQFAAADRWFQRRQVVSVLGMWFGSAVGISVLVATGQETSSAMSWILMAALVGIGVGLSVLHLRLMQSIRRDGPRAATLRPRRILDYLTGPEIVLQYAILVGPLVTAVLGVLVLTGNDRPGSGWSLVVAGLAAFPFAAVGIYLQHRILRLNQPAESEVALRWQEALRAIVLRDLAGIVLMAGWLFGPAVLFFTDWPAGMPGFVEPLTSVIFFGGTLLVVLVMVTAYTKGGVRRSQRIVGQS